MTELIPTWEDALPALLEAIKSDNEKAVRIAEEELVNMARVADLYNEVLKATDKKKVITNKGLRLSLVKSQKD
jgi:hypothetical protein